MKQAKEIFNKYEIGKFMMGDVTGKAKVIAAIQEALDSKDLKVCTGCGSYSDEPLGVNKLGEPFLSCCPDNNYVSVRTQLAAKEKELQELREAQNMGLYELRRLINAYLKDEISISKFLEVVNRKSKL